MVATAGVPTEQDSLPDQADDTPGEDSAAASRARPGWVPVTVVGWLRLVVLGVAAGVTALKLMVAANTFGTNDVAFWLKFANGVRESGPIGVYGYDFQNTALYNHPPLIGYLLETINWLVDRGVADLPFLIRVPASLADVATAVLMFELVRRVRSNAEATIAGLLVACSPVLFVISGFHGNTDPVWVMFVLLSVYLLTARQSPVTGALAGLSFAVAVSIKLVPVLLLPVLLLVVLRSGQRRAVAFLGASAAVMLALWAPVVLSYWPQFSANVLGYEGVAVREWGLVQFSKWLDLPAAYADFLIGPGRFLVLVLCAVLPVLLVWRRPDKLGASVGLALALFLLLSPAFGMQYLVWPLAAAYLVNIWLATVYHVIAGMFVVVVYNRWNSAYPWNWDVAKATVFDTNRQVFLAVATWQALAAVVIAGLLFLRRPDRGDSADPADATRTPLA